MKEQLNASSKPCTMLSVYDQPPFDWQACKMDVIRMLRKDYSGKARLGLHVLIIVS